MAASACLFATSFQAVTAQSAANGVEPVLRGSPGATVSSPSAQSSPPSQPVKNALIGWKTALAEGRLRLKTNELVAAEICFREAVRDVTKNKSNSPDDVVICLESLAAVLQTEDKTEEVIPLYKRSLRMLRRKYGKDSEKTVDTLIKLGDVMRDESLYRRAANYYRPALAVLDKTNGGGSLRYADIEHRLGLTLFKGGYPLAAEKDYDIALSLFMQQSQLPEENPLQDLLSDYIDLLRKSAGRVASSDFQKELLKDQVGTLSRTTNVGESYWSKKVSVNIFDPNAVTKNAQEKLAQAQASPVPPPAIKLDKSITDSVALDQINQQRVQFYERMIAIDIKTLGPQHPSVARDLTGLAYLYLSQNKNDEAKVLLERALRIYKSAYGSDMLVKRTEAMLTLIDRGQQAQKGDGIAIQNYLTALPQIPAAAQKIEVSLRLNYLALLCLSEGKIEAAEKIYPWALGATALACGDQSSLAGCCLNDFAFVLRQAGRKSEADQYESTASGIVSRALAKQAAASLP